MSVELFSMLLFGVPNRHRHRQSQRLNRPELIFHFLPLLFTILEHVNRSDSIEGVSPTSTGPNLIAALAHSDSTSVGTWKLIKGKVSQTFEEIKLSKSSSSSSNQTQPTNVSKGDTQQQPQPEPDSDQENAAVNTSISEEPSLEQEHKHQLLRHHQHHQPQQQQQQQQQRHKGDSDSDIEAEILIEGDVERSRLRRGLANLKSKVKAKTTTHHQHPPTFMLSPAASTTTNKSSKKEAPSTSSSTPTAKRDATAATATAAADTTAAPTLRTSGSATSLRSSFLRKRRKPPVETAELASPSVAPDTPQPGPVPVPGSVIQPVPVPAVSRKTEKKKGIISGKKEVEIESGVEMLEGMIPPVAPPIQPASASGSAKPKRKGMELPLASVESAQFHDADACDAIVGKLTWKPEATSTGSSMKSLYSESSLGHYFTEQGGVVNWLLRHVPAVSIIGLVIIVLLPIHDFIRGVLACLLGIGIIDSVWSIVEPLIERFLITNPPEKVQFQIPDYSKMSICEIPAVEEHTTVKTYAGWMNEINSYDPNDFHMSMTKTVYVKLEGTILRVSSTAARIPKRAMWNEPPIDRKTLTFTAHRSYNLLGGRVELLPLGLARKRFFNRKYPMQLIIKECPGYLDEGNETPLTASGPKLVTAGNKNEDDDMITEKDGWETVLPGSASNTVSMVSAEVVDQRSERSTEVESEVHLATTLLHSNLHILQDTVNPDDDLKQLTVPCGDEVRLLLFSRCDREKEDWYRRFVAATAGDVHDQELRIPDIKVVTDTELQAAAHRGSLLLADPNVKNYERASTASLTDDGKGTSPDSVQMAASTDEVPEKHVLLKTQATPDTEAFEDVRDEGEDELVGDETFEGLIMSSSAARNPADYLRFMVLYQYRRSKRQQDELWKGVDLSLYLGPSGSVVWANVLIGRVLYSCLHDAAVREKLKDILQKKLSSIRFPSFIEDVVITDINLGNTPPLIHRVSQPMLDERGIWIDADLTYEGLLQIQVATKLNLLRVKRHTRPTIGVDTSVPANTAGVAHTSNVTTEDLPAASNTVSHDDVMQDALSSSVIFDSDAESSGGSSSDSETAVPGPVSETTTNPNDFSVFQSSPNNARRIFKIVDRFTASHFFQYATELPYVQRAMENMSTNITLRVDLKGLVARGIINIPPPPSDRVWLSFRGPPRLWLSAKPAVGDKSFDWTIVTNIIESKLCEAVNKFLVYPNMVDITIPFLGQPTYSNH